VPIKIHLILFYQIKYLTNIIVSQLSHNIAITKILDYFYLNLIIHTVITYKKIKPLTPIISKTFLILTYNNWKKLGYLVI